jgi:hypothetical protein
VAHSDGRHFDGRRFRGWTFSSLGPAAIDARQSQYGTIKKGLQRARLGAIVRSLRSPILILIAAPFSSRLSRYTAPSKKNPPD